MTPNRFSLVADIGGTNTRLALVENGGNPRNVHVIEGDSVPDLETAVERYLAMIDDKPTNAVLTVAAPVDGDEITMTNRAWRFRLSALKQPEIFNGSRIFSIATLTEWAMFPNSCRS